jgi:ABC-2 type transport system ATP-binding protein
MIQLHQLTKKYGSFTAVDSLDLHVPAGQLFGFLGPNGAGKTTTLRMINDIIRPDEGVLQLLGGLAPGGDAAPRIGYLPEERGLYPKMRVLDMLAFMGELRGLTGADARRRGLAWLDRLGLGQWHANRVQDLSKGMQQKVQFAATVLHEPELVILDEPWSGLDPINAEVLREVVTEQKAAGRTVLFSTHQMEQAEKICDQVCIIARGKKVLDGALLDIKREAASERMIALGFAGEAARRAATAVLADRAVVASQRPPRPGDTADLEVEMAAGVEPQRLLLALLAAGAAVRRFEVVTPTLHQIFVDRVGGDEATVAARREVAA